MRTTTVLAFAPDAVVKADRSATTILAHTLCTIVWTSLGRPFIFIIHMYVIYIRIQICLYVVAARSSNPTNH